MVLGSTPYIQRFRHTIVVGTHAPQVGICQVSESDLQEIGKCKDRAEILSVHQLGVLHTWQTWVQVSARLYTPLMWCLVPEQVDMQARLHSCSRG